jgi:hypothetical protein
MNESGHDLPDVVPLTGKFQQPECRAPVIRLCFAGGDCPMRMRSPIAHG